MKVKLISTTVKGLYLTIDGKAYRKDLKKELTATTNGKVRYNGKLYSLQKLIALSVQNATKMKCSNQKPPFKKVVSVRELKKNGFYKTSIHGLFVSKEGVCYNFISNRKLTITKGKITIEGKIYNVAKIILETFFKIPIISGQILFKNGINTDFSFENVEYKTTVKIEPPKESDLIKVVRLYFEVPTNFKKSSFMFKYYLHQIAQKRNFLFFESCKGFELFKEWLNIDFSIESKSIYNLSIKNNFTATNGRTEINKYLNLLISESLKDFENGFLKIKDFAKKPPTKTQNLKRIQKYFDEKGLTVKVPLRKLSLKEHLNKYRKTTQELNELTKRPPK